MAVEFSRNITFGQYLNLRSPIHRLDPRAKIVTTGLLIVALLVTRTFGGLAIALVAAAIIQITARIPLNYTLRGMRLLFVTLLIIFVFQVLFYPAAPEDTLWHWWILSISWTGIALAVQILIRVLLLYHLTSTLMFTTPLMDLADGVETLLDPLKRLRVPVNELVMTMVIALKFVPLLVAELERLIKAQTARGARFDQDSLLTRARRLSGVLVPLFVNALARAEVLTTAMNARCYRGGRGRTKRRLLTFRRADYVAMAVALLFAVSIIGVDRVLGV